MLRVEDQTLAATPKTIGSKKKESQYDSNILGGSIDKINLKSINNKMSP